MRLAVVHADDLGMDYADHPADRRRHQLAVALARASGVLSAPGVEVVPAPGPMSDVHLATMFAPAFIRAVKTFSAMPVLAAAPEARHWGITPDVHPYARMHHDSARLAAAAWQAGHLVGTGDAGRAIVPAGGAHHGLPHRANGFGIYNDAAVAIHALRGAGWRRIAYVDLDVHHGDGGVDLHALGAFGHQQLADGALVHRFEFHRRLVGFDFRDDLAGFDGIAFLDQPFRQVPSSIVGDSAGIRISVAMVSPLRRKCRSTVPKPAARDCLSKTRPIR